MAYTQMASVYDSFMAEAPYGKWLDFTKEILGRYGRPVQTIMDLGCGTGEIALKLAEEDFHVTGVDYSPDMLALAAHKAGQRNLPVRWIRQDMRELDGFDHMDLAVSYCDSINYITTEQELFNVFRRVAASLKHDGLFIFDVHSVHFMEHHLINQTFADVTEDASYIWFCTEGDQPGEAFHELTFFSLEGDKYVRFDEIHHQRTFSVAAYKKLLTQAGFENINVYGDFSSNKNMLNEQTERIFFTAENSAGKK